jgi:hypothetical protein
MVHLRVFTSSLIIAVLVCALAGVAGADPSTCEGFSRHSGLNKNVDDVMDFVREKGSRHNLILASGAIMLLGGDQARATVQSYVTAALLSEAVVGPLKYISNRHRPSGTHTRLNSSFPSSHAAMSFAIAASVSRRHPRLSVPAYGLAGLISFSRVYHRRHHLSDVVAGALIGIAAARYAEPRLAGLMPVLPGLTTRPVFRIDMATDEASTARMYLSATF